MSSDGDASTPRDSRREERQSPEDPQETGLVRLADIENDFCAQGALPLSTVAEQQDGGSLAQLAQNVLSVRPQDFGFFAPGEDTKNLYQLFEGTALPLVYGDGATHRVSKEIVVDTPDGPRAAELSQDVLVTRTGELCAETVVRKKVETDGAKLELLSRVRSEWTAGFLPEPVKLMSEPLLLAHVEQKRLGGPVEELEQVLNSPSVGTQIIRKSGEAVHMGRSFACEEETRVEPKGEHISIVTCSRQIDLGEAQMDEVEVTWLINHGKLLEPVIVQVSCERRASDDDDDDDSRAQMSQTLGEIKAESDSVWVWEGHSVPYHQVVTVDSLTEKRHRVLIQRTFRDQPDGFVFAQINDTFIVGTARKTEIFDAHFWYREVVRIDGKSWVEPGDMQIYWPAVALYAALALTVVGLLVWGLIWLCS